MNAMKRREKRAATLPLRATTTAPALHSPRRQVWAALLGLGFAMLLAYSNSFAAGFALDNRTLLLDDPRIRSASGDNLAQILHHTYWWPNGESGLYRPVTTLSYLLNYAIFENGSHPAGYHWINLSLHAANTLLVFGLAWRLLRERAGARQTAFCIALLWAVHPVLTESVTNIVGRADLLAGVAVLSGLLLYLLSAEATGWRRYACFTGLAAATAFGVFSKESAVVLPALIVLYELACGKQWRRMLPACLATLVPIGWMLWQRAAVLSASLPAEYPFTDNPIAGAGFWTARLTAIQVLARYLQLAIWPIRLSADYSYSQIPLVHGSLEDWMSWIAVACAAAGTVILWRRSRAAFFFAGFAFLNLLPASNLLFPIGAIMAERFLYLPLAGLVAAAVILIDAAGGRFRLPGALIVICACVIAAGLGVRTWIRNADWTDDITMATAGVQASPRSFKFHRLLAASLLQADASHRDLERAVAEADRSIAILKPLPDDRSVPGPWNLAAVCHRVRGDTLPRDGARAEYQEAARLALRSVRIDAASRAAYDRRHGVQSAVPASAAEEYRTLASAYLHLEQAGDALAAANQAQGIDPANVGVYEEIADAYLAEDRGEEAAIALAEGAFATGDGSLRDELVKLYQSGLDSKGCAVVAGPRGPALNPSCEIVLKDFCEAALRAHRPDLRGRLNCHD